MQRPWLNIDGERYPLIGALTVIGRDEIADIILDDPGISRRHCEVRVTNDGPHLVTSIRDLGSTNGTYVGKPDGTYPSDPLPPNEGHQLADDERVYLGAWTRVVVRKATAEEKSGPPPA